MPGRLKVKVISGRHLPIMDRASELTDAFVEVKFGSVTHKTEVYLKSLNPYWNSEWFIFEVDDEHLQDEPLQIRVLDHDTYSSHDAIGKVYIDIDPLLVPDSANSLHGWFPIYDTMHGIRGEILITVKIELFADFNRFKKSSCGIKFICGTVVPESYKILSIQGFVEELVVSEDPEYQWIDKLRTPRATNEARQRLFSQVSGELQRRIGMKVMEMSGNAVVGYHQHFDIEGGFGVVVRGIGTAVTLEARVRNFIPPYLGSPTSPASFSPAASSPIANSPVKFVFPHQSSPLDSDLGTLPAAGSNPAQSRNIGHHPNNVLENMDNPFFTLTSFPANFLLHLGGVVSAHSVKLLDKIHNPDEPETRDAWWHEIRREVKSHATVLGCNAVVGYKELTSICDELIILSAQGTAAVVNPSFSSHAAGGGDVVGLMTMKEKLAAGPHSAAVILDSSHPFEKLDIRKRHNSGEAFTVTPPKYYGSSPTPQSSNVSLFQVPYKGEAPFPMSLGASPLDSSVQVPEIIFTTIDIPANVHITGKGTIIQARFCRSKKKGQGESNAASVGDILPFVEYELHKQLYNKLKLRGMNALFGLRVQIHVGENLVIGIATATAAYVTALPQAKKPQLNCQNVKHGSSTMEKIQQQFNVEIDKNKEHFDLNPLPFAKDGNISEPTVVSDLSLLNLSAESKQSLPVSVEDPDDAEQLRSMIDALPPKKCYMSNCQRVPGISSLTSTLQTFSLFWRVRYREGASDVVLNRGLRAICERTYKSIWNRLSRLSPTFCLCGLRFNLIVPEDDEIHIWITASAVEYKNTFRSVDESTVNAKVSSSEHLQFFMETEEKSSTDVPEKGKKSEQVSQRKNDVSDDVMKSRVVPRSHNYSSGADEAQSLDLDISDVYNRSTRSKSLDIKANIRHPTALYDSRSPLRLQMPKSSSDSPGSSAVGSKGSLIDGPSSMHSSGGGSSNEGTTSRHIHIVPMAYLPGCKIQRHIGFVNMFLVRETSAVRGGEEGLPGTEVARGTGSNWFVHCVFVETQALLRAHVAALGGNALTSYRIEQCSLSESVAKNQAQCLVHVCGDAVLCTQNRI